jgi:hypothetical protein
VGQGLVSEGSTKQVIRTSKKADPVFIPLTTTLLDSRSPSALVGCNSACNNM